MRGRIASYIGKKLRFFFPLSFFREDAVDARLAFGCDLEVAESRLGKTTTSLEAFEDPSFFFHFT